MPNVSFQVYAPGFLDRFLESHFVMFQGNAGLKPKEGEITSRPWQWPINYRVIQSERVAALNQPLLHVLSLPSHSQGQFFSGSAYRIYLLGNPVIWWSNLCFLALFVLLYSVHAIKGQRAIASGKEEEEEGTSEKESGAYIQQVEEEEVLLIALN